jgi:hypothetical protein
LKIDTRTTDELTRILTILEKHADIGADCADASLIALAERLDSVAITTLDKDFELYRVNGRRPFRNVFLEP